MSVSLSTATCYMGDWRVTVEGPEPIMGLTYVLGLAYGAVPAEHLDGFKTGEDLVSALRRIINPARLVGVTLKATPL